MDALSCLKAELSMRLYRACCKACQVGRACSMLISPFVDVASVESVHKPGRKGRLNSLAVTSL